MFQTALIFYPSGSLNNIAASKNNKAQGGLKNCAGGQLTRIL